METKSIGSIYLFDASHLMNKVPTNPFAFGASKLEFVAIGIDLLGTHDRADLGYGNLAYACEVVNDLLLFVLELQMVWKDLPFASTTSPVVLAYRWCSVVGIFDKTNDLCFHERMFFLGHLQVHNVTGYAVWDKDDHIVHTSNGFAFCCYPRDGNIFDDRIFFLFHCFDNRLRMNMVCLFVEPMDTILIEGIKLFYRLDREG